MGPGTCLYLQQSCYRSKHWSSRWLAVHWSWKWWDRVTPRQWTEIPSLEDAVECSRMFIFHVKVETFIPKNRRKKWILFYLWKPSHKFSFKTKFVSPNQYSTGQYLISSLWMTSLITCNMEIKQKLYRINSMALKRYDLYRLFSKQSHILHLYTKIS